jgi:alkylation response protein AidB-like acyl-CoA dehydrogenase
VLDVTRNTCKAKKALGSTCTNKRQCASDRCNLGTCAAADECQSDSQCASDSSEIAVRAAEESVQIHGGYGFIKDYPAEKFFRDVKLCTIGEGTSEIQRLVIARQLLGQ